MTVINDETLPEPWKSCKTADEVFMTSSVIIQKTGDLTDLQKDYMCFALNRVDRLQGKTNLFSANFGEMTEFDTSSRTVTTR